MVGVLNIWKPAGVTSRDVVNQIQRLVRPQKVGHAGTLDPLATGVLLVCVGQATRLIEYAHRLPKSYEGTFLLGRRSETDDVEREVEIIEGASRPTLTQIQTALRNFIGKIDQRPPRYSAVKIRGRRAYDLARAGVDFEPAPKTVEIYDLVATHYDYPELKLDVCCSGGTYIRSLGRDLAEVLGTGAVMSALTRTAIGPFTIGDAMVIGNLDHLNEDWQEHLLPPAWLTEGLPQITVTDEEVRELQHGRSIDAAPERLSRSTQSNDDIAAFDVRGNLVAILVERGPGQLGATRNFTQSE